MTKPGFKKGIYTNAWNSRPYSTYVTPIKDKDGNITYVVKDKPRCAPDSMAFFPTGPRKKKEETKNTTIEEEREK